MEAASSGSDESHSSSSSSSSSDEDSSSSDAIEMNSSRPQGSDDEEEESSSDEESSDDDQRQQLSLSERIQQGEGQQSIDIKERRKRKAAALKVATSRLAELQSEKIVEKRKKKKSKHAPAEVSSKRQDFYRRKLQLNESGVGVEIGARRYKPRDPRGESLSGHLNIEHFEKNYSFLQEIRDKEIKTLKQRIAARKVTGKKGQNLRHRLGITQVGSLDEDKEELKRLQMEKADVDRKQVDRNVKRAVKKKLQQEVEEGKRGSYFPKRRELKRMHVEAKFDELRKRGGVSAVQKAVAKRRKKNKSRDAGLLGGRSLNE